MPDFIKIHPSDNVAVALRAIPAGTVFQGVAANTDIPQGHKMALVNMEENTHVMKYGFSIGHTTAAITAGDWVHTHNMVTNLEGEMEYTYNPKVVVITMGKKGGIIYDGNKAMSYPVFPVTVVDSNGSGDVFHGAFAAGLTRGYDFYKCCIFASATSAIKCTGVGARQSAPNFESVASFLKENGYEL